MCRGARIPPERAAQGARAVCPSVRVGARERLAVCGFRHDLLCSARFACRRRSPRCPSGCTPSARPRARRGARPDAPARSGAAPSPTRAPAPAARPSTRDSRDEDLEATAETSPDTASASSTASTAADEDAPDLSIPASTAENSMRSAVKLRPVLGRLALCRNDPSLAPYEHLLWTATSATRADPGDRNQRGFSTAFADSYKTRSTPTPTAPRATCATSSTPRRRASVPHRRLQRLGALGTRRRG